MVSSYRETIMPQLSLLRPGARKPLLFAAALLALGVILACLLPAQALLLAQTLQHQWDGLHGVSDNLRGALAPDTGGKAACRSGALRTLERAMPRARALYGHTLAWLATGHNGEGEPGGSV
jgi:hypothetical protein